MPPDAPSLRRRAPSNMSISTASGMCISSVSDMVISSDSDSNQPALLGDDEVTDTELSSSSFDADAKDRSSIASDSEQSSARSTTSTEVL